MEDKDNFSKWTGGVAPAFNEVYYDDLAEVIGKVNKMKKNNVASGYDEMTIGVVANGYVITVGNGTAENRFVFPDMKSMNEWMKDNLAPTKKNAEFMEAL